jgi:hypothetical protein
MASVGPPAAAATSMRTGRSGQEDCAKAVAETESKTTNASREFIGL